MAVGFMAVALFLFAGVWPSGLVIAFSSATAIGAALVAFGASALAAVPRPLAAGSRVLWVLTALVAATGVWAHVTEAGGMLAEIGRLGAVLGPVVAWLVFGAWAIVAGDGRRRLGRHCGTVAALGACGCLLGYALIGPPELRSTAQPWGAYLWLAGAIAIMSASSLLVSQLMTRIRFGR